MIESWDDNKFSELKGGNCDYAAKSGKVVFITMPDLFDKSMGTKTFEHSRKLRCGYVLKTWTKGTRLESADSELAADYSLEEIQVSTMEQVKTAITAIALARWLGDFLQGTEAGTGIIYGSQEVEIAMGGSTEEIMQSWQTIDRLAHGSEFECGSPIAMFHRTVVFEKGHVIGGAFHTSNKPELVIELYSHWPHVVLNTCALDTGVKVVANFPLVVGGQLTSKESNNVFWLDSMDGSMGDGGIERLEISLSLEDNVGGIFHLHQTPMISRGKISSYRAILSGNFVEVLMEPTNIQCISQCLSTIKVGNVDKGIFQHGISDPFFLEFDSQFIMPIEIELQAEWCPGRHTKVTQPQLWMNEIEVVMQAFRLGGLEISLAGSLIMPRFKGGAGLHCREDMNHTGVIAPLVNNRLDAFFLPEIVAPDEFDVQSILTSKLLGVCTDLLTELPGKQRIIKEANPLDPQMTRHGLCMADIWQRTSNYYPVEAGQGAKNFA